MDTQKIVVRGAREHNLRSVNLELPKNKLIIITGPSGSGKARLRLTPFMLKVVAAMSNRFHHMLASFLV